MGSYLLAVGDRQALAWILTARRMAFSESRAAAAQLLRPDDNLLLYTTRGCFGNPERDRGRVIGQATVSSEVRRLATPVTFGDRTFPVGCSLTLQLLAPFRSGIELVKCVHQMHAFPQPDNWGVYLRRTLVPLDQHDYDLLLKPLSEIAVQPSEAVSEYVAHGTPRASWLRADAHRFG